MLPFGYDLADGAHGRGEFHAHGPSPPRQHRQVDPDVLRPPDGAGVAVHRQGGGDGGGAGEGLARVGAQHADALGGHGRPRPGQGDHLLRVHKAESEGSEDRMG